jgi:predicted transcriptional regulator
MSDKETVLEVVRELSDEATFDEILDHLTIIAAIRRGARAAVAGRVLRHDEMERRTESWSSKSSE